jgi:hypothetical protein
MANITKSTLARKLYESYQKRLSQASATPVVAWGNIGERQVWLGVAADALKIIDDEVQYAADAARAERKR